MTILVLLVLNIALPTLDTVTDINLVVKLYRGAQYCDYDWEIPTWIDIKILEDRERDRDDYKECRKDPVSFCSNDGNNQTVCGFSSHSKMATAMLTPFLLNYIVCFITFLRKEKNKKFTFIFALLNIYPQFGKNNYKEKSLESLFPIFQRPPGSSSSCLKILPKGRSKRKYLTKMSVYWKHVWSQCRHVI